VETARNFPMTGARDAVRKYEIDRRSQRLGEIVNLLAAS
jgi:hypothetical protein